MLTARGRCRAFSLLEVLTAVAIVAMLAAVVIPRVLSRLADSRVDAIIGEMTSLQDGINLYQRDVGRYPPRLDYLTVLPSTATDACGVALSTGNRNKYRGPYINRVMSDTLGAAVAVRYVMSTADSVKWAITYVPPVSGSQHLMQIELAGPELSVIEAIDVKVDGLIGGTQGTVRYATPLNPNEYTLLWTVPIRNGTC